MFTDWLQHMDQKTGGQDFWISPLLASSLWVGLCLAVAIAGIATGVSLQLSVIAAVFAALPALLHILTGATNRGEGSEIWIVFSWIIVGLVAVLFSGAAVSPLIIMLALGPMHALSLARFRLGLEASIFAGIGFLGIAAVSVFGLPMPATESFGVLIGLAALISVLQIGVFAASAGGVIAERRDQNRQIDQWINTLSDTPVLIISMDQRRRVKSWIGDLRLLPGMTSAKLAYGNMQDILVDPYSAIRNIGSGEPVVLRPEFGEELAADFLSTRDGYRLVVTRPHQNAALVSPEQLAAAELAGQGYNEEAIWVASLGHELRNMLNPVGGYSDLILSEPAGPVAEPYKNFARSIKQGAEHLGLLVDDLMTAAKGRSGRLRLEPEDLDVMLEAEDAVRLLQWQAEAHSVTVNLAPNDDAELMAHLDRKSLRQILINLLSNAVKYSPMGQEVEVSVVRSGDTIEVSVRDHGEGMPAEELARLGEPFFQGENAKERPGTGLGLSIVKMLAEAMEGSVTFESVEGEGTCAIVRFPALSAQS